MVSVIVPVYNGEKYLNKCVESLLNQTYSEIEIILVDDGSTDNSGKICDTYQEKDDRIVVLHKANGGVSSARNEGLKVAKGKYIAFVDSDDWVHKEYIACLTEGLNWGADLVICSMTEIAEREITDVAVLSKQYLQFDRNECFQKMLYSTRIGGFLWNKLFRKELITCALKENIYYSEDFVFCAQYAENIKQAVFIDIPLYYYWQNASSVTNMHGVYNDKIFSLLEAEKLLREIYISNLPDAKDDITLNLIKVALNLRARYKYNKCNNAEQYQAIEEVIKEYYPNIKRSDKICFREKVNIFMTKNFPVLLLKLKSVLLGRKLKR